VADFVDTFTEAGAADVRLEDHTPDTGTGWTIFGAASQAATVRYDTDTLTSNDVSNDAYYTISPELSSADQEIEIKTVVWSSLVNDSYCCVRLVDWDNWYGWRLAGTGASGRRLCENVAGVITDIDTSQGVQNEWIKVKADGTTIELYEGGTGAAPGTYTLIHSATGETDHSTEKSCGIRLNENNSTDWITEFRATSLAVTAMPAYTPSLQFAVRKKW
jgi:hypothetical protein